MRQVMQKPIVENLPKVGYYVSKEEKKENIYKDESYIHKQGPLSGVKAEAHKLYSDFLVYFPKGFQGSKNSDFYEYLSLGMVPYLIGSAMLIGVYSGAKNQYLDPSKMAAGNIAKSMGAGVVLYGIGKWLSKKISHKLIKASTGVDLDMRYLNKVSELPENGNDKGITRVQYPGVFDSADFPRKDLIAQDSELNYDNVYAYEDKIAKKAGFKNKLSAPNQVMWPKIRELKVRATALENVSKYIMAATGVALGSQKAFENLQLKNPNKLTLTPLGDGTKGIKSINDLFGNIRTIGKNVVTNFKTSFKNAQIGMDGIKDSFKLKKDNFKYISENAKQIWQNRAKDTPITQTLQEIKKMADGTKVSNNGIFATLKNGFKQLWNGTDRNFLTKHLGKVLIGASIVSTVLSWLVPTIGFKKNPDTMVSRVDGKKDYEVC